jgi:hypothetical protein
MGAQPHYGRHGLIAGMGGGVEPHSRDRCGLDVRIDAASPSGWTCYLAIRACEASPEQVGSLVGAQPWLSVRL